MTARPLGKPTRARPTPTGCAASTGGWPACCAGLLRAAEDPLVVDLGFGASPVTTVELADRLAAVRHDVEVVGIEIDRERVAAAQRHASRRTSFRHGGFELPTDGRRPVLVRAMNVLRQYEEAAAPAAWRRLGAALAPGGLVVDGTCDEIGRRATWLAVDAHGRPTSLTLSAHPASLDRPSELAERLPKALIHRNSPGEPVHRLLVAMDRCWATAAPYATFGPRQRWLATVDGLRAAGWPVTSNRTQVRRGELTVPWAAVAALDAVGRELDA